MLLVNKNLFSKQMVKTFFDLRIKVKYNILRLKNLKIYMKKDRVKRIHMELQDFNKEISEYMEIYSERFHRNPIRNNLIESKENNSYLIENIKKREKQLKNLRKKMIFQKEVIL